MFELDAVLANDTVTLGDFPLSRLLLSRDANYPWFILVPRRPGITEICDLSWEDQLQLLRESGFLCEQLRSWFRPHKLNIAALGNVVPQLHVHHIVRYRDDRAWPAPVWGKHPPAVYEPGILHQLLQRFASLDGGPAFRAAVSPP
jgi:diadenosine tetraphosphate (Ap4A) HIT family hydrolase